MGQPALKKTNNSKLEKRKNEERPTNDVIKERQTKELVIGFCGAVGAGIRRAKEPLIKELKNYGYQIQKIRISELLVENAKNASYPNFFELANLTSENRYIKLQELGNFYRQSFGLSFPAELAIHKINELREQNYDGKPQKIAYIVDQLKHPQEAEVLRLVYQNNFYLLGVYRERMHRKKNLRDEGISTEVADKIIETDRKEKDGTGQQLEKTFHTSDYFITNSGNAKELEKKVERFIALIHGGLECSPTLDEKGMYSAYSASLNSLCLSRQVGAAIQDNNGNILSVGFNDAPAFGGGLYHSDMKVDNRCIFKGKKCYNDEEKQRIRNKTYEIVKFSIENSIDSEALDKINVDELSQNIVQEINSETKIGSLIEFSRAIHAEMEALLALTRTGGASSINTTLFSTTYPCHNCARHIIASGIKRVVFIEPYEKSMAVSLHDDAITETSEQNKVVFQSFEGVSPRSYNLFFKKSVAQKNDNGKAIEINIQAHKPASIQFLDNYRDIEDKVSHRVLANLKLE